MFLNFRTLLVLILFFSLSSMAMAQFTISGYITTEDNVPLDYASVFLVGTEYAAATNSEGFYEINDVPTGSYMLKVTYVGYAGVETPIVVTKDMTLNVPLNGQIFEIDKIEINATRAATNAPITETTMSKEEIEDANLVHDVPYVLKWMPSVTVTSDAGHGVGYTGIRVRGSEASRTNVTINGVPLNDSESQSVFWVDLPDFMATTEDVQIQRGVGVSTNGTSAFGANINLNTQKINLKPYATLSGSYGSYNTSKLSAQVGTGLMNDKFSIDARYSKINSDGYIDRSKASLTSAFLSAVRVVEGSSLRLNIASGHEITGQAWNGLPVQYIDSDRTYNSAGTERDGEPYNNEVDNYRQSHYQLIYNKSLGERSKLNATLHYTKGKGFYENYKGNETLADYALPFPQDSVGDVIRRKWLNNDFIGGIYSYMYSANFADIVFGGGVNKYFGAHYGEAVWNSIDKENSNITEYYNNDAEKFEWNNYLRLTGNFSENWIPFFDLQYRYIDYSYVGPGNDGSLSDQNEKYNFFNPKLGLSYFINKNNKIFAYYGQANREPSRNEFVSSTPNSRPEHETLHDIEIGYQMVSKWVNLNTTFYNMQYKNQLVPTGELNDVGEYNRVNVDDSYRRGIELGIEFRPFKGFSLQYNGTISENKIDAFDEYIDSWDTGEQIVVAHTDTDIAFSPSNIHSIRAKYDTRINKNHKIECSISHKYVDKQYLDNTGNENTSIPSFNYTDLQVVYHFNIGKIKDIALNILVSNIFDNEYYNNGWTYRFKSEGYDPRPYDPSARLEGDGVYNLTGVYVQAPLNFIAGLTFKF